MYFVGVARIQGGMQTFREIKLSCHWVHLHFSHSVTKDRISFYRVVDCCPVPINLANVFQLCVSATLPLPPPPPSPLLLPPIGFLTFVGSDAAAHRYAILKVFARFYFLRRNRFSCLWLSYVGSHHLDESLCAIRLSVAWRFHRPVYLHLRAQRTASDGGGGGGGGWRWWWWWLYVIHFWLAHVMCS